MKGLILYITSIILVGILYPIAMFYGLFISFYDRQVGEGLKTVDSKLLYLAIMKDETGTIYDSGVSIGIGQGNTTLRFLKGNIYQTQLYNRALSAQEVLQNYNALKGRFGLT